MPKLTKPILHLFLITLAGLLLTTPALAQREEGRVLNADLSGVITMQQEDGSTGTIDYGGELEVGVRGKQIVIDIIHAGVVRETGEPVSIHATSVGVYQREGNQIRFTATGLYTLEREDGSRIVIDITAAGIIQQRGRNIVIDIIHAGVVQGSGENIRIHITGAGDLQYAGDVSDGTDI